MPSFTRCAFPKVQTLFAVLICLVFKLNAQNGSTHFAMLGSEFYKSRITELEKFKAPKLYTDKSAQAWYEEILTDRNKDLLYSFTENKVLYDTLLLNKCNEIFRKIAAANKDHKFDSIRLYINRSMVANAANYGEGTVMINLGLFLWVDNDDELALVLGHELAHQLLRHSDSKIAKSISMLTSDDFRQELKDIKKSEYGKFDRFRKLMKGIHVESGKHSTYKESEADSLGLRFIKNAGYNPATAAKILLKFDKIDELFTSGKVYSSKTFFAETGIDLSYFKTQTRYKGLSSANVTMNADKDMDSVKTHPDCTKRYEAITGMKSSAASDCCLSISQNYRQYKERAMLEIVRYLYENNSIGLCTHLSIFALQNNFDQTTYKRFLSLCFSRLYYSDKNIQRFSTANAYANRETTLKELQDFLFAVNTKDLETLALHFLSGSIDHSSDDYEFANMMFNTEVKMADKQTSYNSFNVKFPKNKYQYLLKN